uniref:6PF2K domain-containing protein n=1 Tax=Angiostrongylus cantonensis TaxID=6313 RepID=A0A0K0D102_ANGCA
MVGLPARGKTYISHKLCRYLNWIGIKTKAFNVGEYRRRACASVKEGDFEFFSPYNIKGTKIRDECARLAIDDMGHYLSSKEGEVAVSILDATNTTRDRRRLIVDYCSNPMFYPPFRVFFVESVCEDEHIVNTNITEVKISSPDYKDIMSHEEATADFLKRIENYKLQYEPLDEHLDSDLSFIKAISCLHFFKMTSVFNAGKSFYVQNVKGHVQSRVVYFLMNIHLLPPLPCISLYQHGESEYNRIGRLGGDSPLSENGVKFAESLKDYFMVSLLNASKNFKAKYTCIFQKYSCFISDVHSSLCVFTLFYFLFHPSSRLTYLIDTYLNGPSSLVVRVPA